MLSVFGKWLAEKLKLLVMMDWSRTVNDCVESEEFAKNYKLKFALIIFEIFNSPIVLVGGVVNGAD